MKSINTKSIVSAAVLAIAALGTANSFAATNYLGTEGEIINLQAFVGTKARADVRAEVVQAAKQAHAMVETEGLTQPAAEFVSTRSRAEVRSEAVVAAHSHVTTGSL